MILSGIFDIRVLLLAATLLLFHASAGVVNDIADYEIDRINAPERPLVKGVISFRQAKYLALGLILSALFCAWLLAPWFFAVALTVGLPIEIIYNRYPGLKNNALGSILYLSFCVSPLPFLIGCLVSGRVTLNSLSLSVVLLLLSSCIALGSFKDIEGDKYLGKRTFVVTLGVKRASQVMAALLVSSIAMYVVIVAFFSFSAMLLVLSFPLSIVRGALACGTLSDASPLKAQRMVVIARLLIVSDHVAMIVARPAGGI